LTVEQALRAVTIDAAHSIRMERDVGSIEPGKLANFTILDADPFTVAQEAIKDINVLATVSEGTVHPILPQGTKRAAAGNTGPVFGKSALHELALAQSIVDRGMTAGCSCCQPVQNAVCTADTAPASAAGCCSTNALGWMVAGLWSVRVTGQI
jgi:hypothetical protein